MGALSVPPRALRQKGLRRVFTVVAVERGAGPASLARTQCIEVVPRVHVLQGARAAVGRDAVPAAITRKELGRVATAELAVVDAVVHAVGCPRTAADARVAPHSHYGPAAVRLWRQAEIVLATAVSHVVCSVCSVCELREVRRGRRVHSAVDVPAAANRLHR